MGEDWGRAGTYTWHPWHQHHADTSTDRSDDWVDIESGRSQVTTNIGHLGHGEKMKLA